MTTLPVHWQPLAARSLVHIAFAALALGHGGLSMPALAVASAALLLLDSCLAVFCTVPDARPRGIVRVQVTSGLVTALAVALTPRLEGQALVALMALWAAACGASDVALEVRARRMPDQVHGALPLAAVSLAGACALSVVAASGLFVPGVWLGVHCLFVGSAMATFALRLRAAEERQAVLRLPRRAPGQAGTLYALIK